MALPLIPAVFSEVIMSRTLFITHTRCLTCYQFDLTHARIHLLRCFLLSLSHVDLKIPHTSILAETVNLRQ